MAKSANEISLEAKKKAIQDTVNKSDDESMVCLFETVEEINERLMNISDTLDHFPSDIDMMTFKIMLKDNMDRLDSNTKKCNEMINELKGVVSMARAALAERKECDDVRKSNKCVKNDCKNVLKDNRDEIIQTLIRVNIDLHNILETYLNKKWWQFWK